ncbi:MAG: hypothetical protein JKX97_08900 [Candidatus Lindowbacteria bacterium]|nr:hypothetical protein [Candidatus Lindowbacteria bacterium]
MPNRRKTQQIASLLCCIFIISPALVHAEDLYPLRTRSGLVDNEPYSIGLDLGVVSNEALPFSTTVPSVRDKAHLPNIRLIAPMGARAVFRAEWPVLRVSDIDFPTARDATITAGDPWLEMEGMLIRNGWGHFDVSALLGAKIPSAREKIAAGTNQVDMLLEIAASRPLINTRIHLNLGLHIADVPDYAVGKTGNPATNSQDDTLRYGLAITAPWGDRTLMLEYHGNAMSRFNNNFAYVRGGIRNPLSDDWLLTGSMALGTTKESGEIEANFGLTRYFR